MTLINLEDAKAEVRKVVSDLKTRCEINYRLNSLPSIEFEEYLKNTEPQTEQAVFSKAILTSNNGVVKVEPQTEREGE